MCMRLRSSLASVPYHFTPEGGGPCRRSSEQQGTSSNGSSIENLKLGVVKFGVELSALKYGPPEFIQALNFRLSDA